MLLQSTPRLAIMSSRSHGHGNEGYTIRAGLLGLPCDTEAGSPSITPEAHSSLAQALQNIFSWMIRLILGCL